MYRAALLDVDGTLVDSNDVNAQAWVEALGENGYDVPFEKVRPLIGLGGDHFLPQAIGQEKDSPVGKKISERRAELLKSKYMPTIKPFPEAKALLDRIHALGAELVTATSAKEDEADALLQILGASDLFDVKTTASDAEHTKPDPDILQAALKKAGLNAGEAIMIGDTPYDVQAAQKAGVPVIAFRCGGRSDSDLTGALAIYDDPADLLAHYDESPLGHG